MPQVQAAPRLSFSHFLYDSFTLQAHKRLSVCALSCILSSADQKTRTRRDMKLTKYTIEALEHKLCVAEETLETLPDGEEQETIDDWTETVRQIKQVTELEVPTVEALKANPKAIKELADYATFDMPKAEFEAITADLCRVGYHEKFDPNAGRTYRPRLRTVDGVKYEIGTI